MKRNLLIAVLGVSLGAVALVVTPMFMDQADARVPDSGAKATAGAAPEGGCCPLSLGADKKATPSSEGAVASKGRSFQDSARREARDEAKTCGVAAKAAAGTCPLSAAKAAECSKTAAEKAACDKSAAECAEKTGCDNSAATCAKKAACDKSDAECAEKQAACAAKAASAGCCPAAQEGAAPADAPVEDGDDSSDLVAKADAQ
jgi:hypothetical protein